MKQSENGLDADPDLKHMVPVPGIIGKPADEQVKTIPIIETRPGFIHDDFESPEPTIPLERTFSFFLSTTAVLQGPAHGRDRLPAVSFMTSHAGSSCHACLMLGFLINT